MEARVPDRCLLYIKNLLACAREPWHVEVLFRRTQHHTVSGDNQRDSNCVEGPWRSHMVARSMTVGQTYEAGGGPWVEPEQLKVPPEEVLLTQCRFQIEEVSVH